MRKCKQANKSFLTGTVFLGVAVIAIVILFLTQAYNLSQSREERMQQDVFRFILTDDFEGQELAVWMNDSLIAVSPTIGDTITHCRIAEETSLLLEDRATGHVTIIEIPKQKGTFFLRKP